MKYMIIRIDDERSSDLCKEIEEKALNEGGLEFPFTIGKYTYESDTIEKAMRATGDYYTHVFHGNCRSNLVPVSENSNLMYPGKRLDDIDRTMLTDGALSESATANMVESGEVSNVGLVTFLKEKFKVKMKRVIGFLFRR